MGGTRTGLTRLTFVGEEGFKCETDGLRVAEPAEPDLHRRTWDGVSSVDGNNEDENTSDPEIETCQYQEFREMKLNSRSRDGLERRGARQKPKES